MAARRRPDVQFFVKGAGRNYARNEGGPTSNVTLTGFLEPSVRQPFAGADVDRPHHRRPHDAAGSVRSHLPGCPGHRLRLAHSAGRLSDRGNPRRQHPGRDCRSGRGRAGGSGQLSPRCRHSASREARTLDRHSPGHRDPHRPPWSEAAEASIVRPREYNCCMALGPSPARRRNGRVLSPVRRPAEGTRSSTGRQACSQVQVFDVSSHAARHRRHRCAVVPRRLRHHSDRITAIGNCRAPGGASVSMPRTRGGDGFMPRTVRVQRARGSRAASKLPGNHTEITGEGASICAPVKTR